MRNFICIVIVNRNNEIKHELIIIYLRYASYLYFYAFIGVLHANKNKPRELSFGRLTTKSVKAICFNITKNNQETTTILFTLIS